MKQLSRGACVLGALVIGNVAVAETQDYESLLGCQKEKVLWESIQETEYGELPSWTGTEPLKIFSFVLPWKKNEGKAFMGVTMTRMSDHLPEGRQKHIHTFGSTAPVAFVSNQNHPFTGLYEGVDCGLMRVSLATKPDAGGTVPGLAVKLFVDGKPSKNFMAMNALDGQESYNFFQKDFTNWIGDPESPVLKIFMQAFKLVSSDPAKIDVSFLADTTQDGRVLGSDSVVAAEQIYLEPNRKQLNFSDEAHEVRNDMGTIEAGTELYKVFARAKGSSQKIEVGAIVLKDRFIASRFGDENLFFRHENIDNVN